MPDPNAQNGEARIDRIERAIEALTSDVHALSGGVQELTRNGHALTGDVHALTGDVHALTGDVQALTGDVQTLTGSHRTMAGDLAAVAESHFRLINAQKDQYRELLGGQVILKDAADAQLQRAKLADQRMDRFEKGMDEMREALHALISVVDDMVRRKPPQN